jgi:hypothetical protein
MKLFEIKGTRKSIEARIKELEQYLSVKDRVLRGGNALSPGERQNVIATKKEIEQLKKQLKITEGVNKVKIHLWLAKSVFPGHEELRKQAAEMGVKITAKGAAQKDMPGWDAFISGDEDKVVAYIHKYGLVKGSSLAQAKKFVKNAQLDEDTDSDGKEVSAGKDVPPAEDTELDDADQRPTAKDDAEENEDEGTEDADQPQDVGSVAEREGFTKSKKEMYAFGATRPVTLLTKNQKIGGMDITLQYVINPKTGAWSLRACLAGQSDEDMVEFTTGEDPSSLAKNLQKKTKITPHQLVDNLNPPADKVAKPKPAEKPETDDEEDKDEVTEGMGAMDVAVKTNLRYCSPVIAFDDDNKWYVNYCLYGKDEKPKTEGPFKSEAAAKMRSNAIIVQHMKKKVKEEKLPSGIPDDLFELLNKFGLKKYNSTGSRIDDFKFTKEHEKAFKDAGYSIEWNGKTGKFHVKRIADLKNPDEFAMRDVSGRKTGFKPPRK